MKRLSELALIVFAVLAASATLAQPTSTDPFPSKPLRFIVPFSAGSATDQAARFIGQKLAEKTGQQVLVDNRPGANGIIGVQAAKAAPANGYTVLLGALTTHAANSSLIKDLPYDPIKDFTPLTGLIRGALILVVNPASPYQSVSALLAAARQTPGKLTFASGNFSTRGGGELMKIVAGVDLVHVPYKGVPATMTDLVAGRVDMAFPDMVTAMPLIRSGRLRALAVSSSTRSPVMPDVPTMAEAGVSGYEITGWAAAWVPAGVPPDILAKLNKLFVDVLQSKEATEFFNRDGWESFAGPPEALAEWQRKETAKWARIIEVGKIQVE